MKKIIGLALLFLVAGCSNSPGSASFVQDISQNKRMLVDEYHIGVDDRVQVNVWKHPDFY